MSDLPKTPLPLGEREGPQPKVWEGEGTPRPIRHALTLPPLRGSLPLPRMGEG